MTLPCPLCLVPAGSGQLCLVPACRASFPAAMWPPCMAAFLEVVRLATGACISEVGKLEGARGRHGCGIPVSVGHRARNYRGFRPVSRETWRNSPVIRAAVSGSVVLSQRAALRGEQSCWRRGQGRE